MRRTKTKKRPIDFDIMVETSLLVIVGQRLVREALIDNFKRSSQFKLAGQAGNFDSAIEIIEKTKPGVILLDSDIILQRGFEIMRFIQITSSASKVIALSGNIFPSHAKKIFCLGAMAYFTRAASSNEIKKAIPSIIDGKIYIWKEKKNVSESEFRREDQSETSIYSLTLRELNIAQYVNKGLTSKEISKILCISSRTVEVHRHNILRKLNLRNTASLVNNLHSFKREH